MLPLPDLLSKFKRSKLLAARKAKFFISARARKKIAVHGMLANARKDHSSPLLLVPSSIFLLKSPFPRKLNNVVLVCTFISRPSNTSCKSLIHVSTYLVQISLPAALRLL